MKKLMIALSAAAMAFGLKAADVTLPIADDFNSYPAGPFTATGWSGVGDSTVSETPYTYSGTGAAYAGIPDQHRGTAAEKNVAVKTPLTAPMYYTLDGDTGIGMSGVYFDSLVKFTACDEDATVVTDAKIMVWTKEMTNASGEVTGTNLMVTAGYFKDNAGGIDPKVYDCGSITSYDFDDEWCRLTIKSIADITSGDSMPGFVVFVNGKALTIAGTGTALDIGVTGSAADSLAPTAQIWKNNNHLFPSMVGSDPTIKAVGFAGQGAVDDLSFITGEPTLADASTEFAKDSAAFFLKWTPADVTAVSYDGTAVDNLASGSQLIAVDGVTDIDVDVTYAEDKMAGTWTAKDGATVDGTTFTTGATGGEGTIVAQAVGATFNGKSYATIAEAVADANKIDVAGDYTLKLWNDCATGGLDINNATEGVNIIIDLAGKTITAGGDDTAAIMVSAGSVMITNSVADAEGVVDGNGALAVFGIGDVTITAGTFDGQVQLVSGLITGGKFDDVSNDAETLKGFLADGLALTDDNGYYVVSEVQKVGFIMTIVQGATRQYKIGDATEWTAYAEQVDVEPGTTVAWQYVAGTGIWLKGTTEGSEVVNAETTVGASITAEDGTETNPYTIASVADLKKFAAEVNGGNDFADKFVAQTADINLNNEAWDGIGSYAKDNQASSKSFAGTYDGQNKTISNLKLTNGKYKGLFNSVWGTSDSAKAVVKNLTVDNIAMVGGTGDYGMAAFFGGAANAELINLTANGTSGTTFTHNSAGIVVHAHGHCTFKDCVNNIAITVAGDGKVAGIAAVLQGSDDQILEACTNTAAITGDAEAAAGLIDYCNTAVTIKDCANSGVITATKCNYGDSSIKAQFVTYGENGKARTLQGVNTALKSDVLVMGVTQVANAFGTTDGTTITFPVTPAVSGSYIALGKTAKPIVTLQKDEAITIDWNGFTADVSGITAESGCKIEATGEGQPITYTAVKAAEPVKPGEVIECDDEEDAKKKAEEAEVVIEDKAAADAGQANVVKAAAVKVGDKWTVQVVINTAAEAYKAPEQAVPSVAEALAEIAAGEDPTITVPAANVTPGLYYSIVGDSDVNFGNQVEGDRVLATGSNLSLKAPTVTGGKAFFKVSENLKPTPANP